jgi:hypothetical protein
MFCLFIYVVAVVLVAWVDFIAIRKLSRRRAGPLWWTAVGVLFLLGVAVGIWCAFYCEYHVSDRLRVISFPVPAAYFLLEDGQWVDYVTAVPILIVLLNVVSVAAVTVLPASAVCLMRRTRP